MGVGNTAPAPMLLDRAGATLEIQVACPLAVANLRKNAAETRKTRPSFATTAIATAIAAFAS